MKKVEDYGLVLSTKGSEDNKSARIVGTNHFQLVDLELNPDANIKVQDKIFIGKSNDIVKQERAQLSYDDLNKNEEFELEKQSTALSLQMKQNMSSSLMSKANKQANCICLMRALAENPLLKS